MTGGQFMVVMIVGIVMIASVIRARYTHRQGSNGEASAPQERAETLRLRDEVKELKQRLQVLERIATDRENSLARQIDELRDR
jgi:uncharacterized protein YlxW (UPF0749 family)